MSGRQVEVCFACLFAEEVPPVRTSHPGFPNDVFLLLGAEMGATGGNWRERLCSGHRGLYDHIAKEAAEADAAAETWRAEKPS